MIVIPAGDFLMGSEDGAENERPVHRVYVDQFAIARFPVTNQQYRYFIDDAGRVRPKLWDDPRFNQPDQPVTSVSWFDATAFCEWHSARTGEDFRLPTEADWERAASGGLDG